MVPYVFVWSAWCDRPQILIWGGMDKCYSNSHRYQGTKVMNMCQIIAMYLNRNKHYGKKAVFTMEPGTGST